MVIEAVEVEIAGYHARNQAEARGISTPAARAYEASNMSPHLDRRRYERLVPRVLKITSTAARPFRPAADAHGKHLALLVRETAALLQVSCPEIEDGPQRLFEIFKRLFLVHIFTLSFYFCITDV